jgi:hypothetical protein
MEVRGESGTHVVADAQIGCGAVKERAAKTARRLERHGGTRVVACVLTLVRLSVLRRQAVEAIRRVAASTCPWSSVPSDTPTKPRGVPAATRSVQLSLLYKSSSEAAVSGEFVVHMGVGADALSRLEKDARANGRRIVELDLSEPRLARRGRATATCDRGTQQSWRVGVLAPVDLVGCRSSTGRTAAVKEAGAPQPEEAMTMQYLLTIWMEEPEEFVLTPEAMEPWKVFNNAAAAAGVLRGGSGLQPSTTATTVRGGGEVVLTDGPFVETKEQLAGYYVVDCADLDEAIAWAKKVPAVVWGAAIEVRPVVGGTDITENSDAAGTAAS